MRHQKKTVELYLSVPMLKKIYNPKSAEYLDFKKYCMGEEITWNWSERHCEMGDYNPPDWDEDCYNFGFFGHVFLLPPNERFLYSVPISQKTTDAHDVVRGILEFNKIKVDRIYRIAVNVSLPIDGEGHSLPHTDHPFPHKNLIVYLTNPEGGSTICEGEEFTGKEDDAIIFEGKHYNYPPKRGRRMVIVATFSDYD